MKRIIRISVIDIVLLSILLLCNFILPLKSYNFLGLPKYSQIES